MKHSAKSRPSSPSGKSGKFKPRSFKDSFKDGGKKRFYTDKSKSKASENYPGARPPAKHVDTPPGTYAFEGDNKKSGRGKRSFGDFKKPRRDDRAFSSKHSSKQPMERDELSGREEKAWHHSRPHKAEPHRGGAYKAGGHKTRFASTRPHQAPRPTPDYKPAGDNVLIWGLHAARAAWLNPKRRCSRLWLTEAGKATFEASILEAKEALLKRPDAKVMERHELDRLTPPGSVHQGIILEVAPLHEPSLQDVINIDNPPDLLMMLDQVTDPHNVGAILRSAAAFGAGGVIMTERNAPTMTGVQAKAASGATEHVPNIHVVNLARAIEDLQQAGYWCVGLAEEGEKELSQLDLSGRTVLVLGNEGEGLRQLTRKKCDELARLPTGGAIGSLNVSNAAAVSLYEVRRQKGKS